MKREMGQARPLDGPVSLGKVHAKTFWLPGVAEMALFRELVARRRVVHQRRMP
jgi:hypothetical protein